MRLKARRRVFVLLLLRSDAAVYVYVSLYTGETVVDESKREREREGQNSHGLSFRVNENQFRASLGEGNFSHLRQEPRVCRISVCGVLLLCRRIVCSGRVVLPLIFLNLSAGFGENREELQGTARMARLCLGVSSDLSRGENVSEMEEGARMIWKIVGRERALV